jgi:hypothetical protein
MLFTFIILLDSSVKEPHMLALNSVILSVLFGVTSKIFSCFTTNAVFQSMNVDERTEMCDCKLEIR